jgi:DNA topoisomerase I
MGKHLVIVESPAKAKTINKYLGRDYVVRSSVGHIRDLPTSGSSAAEPAAKRRSTNGLSPEEKAERKRKREWQGLVRRMGVDPSRGWAANYEILPGKEKVLAELKKLAKEADRIFLATDLDREGEAIAWHLREAIGGDDDRYCRVTFAEITKRAIQAAFNSPGELDMDRVNAQQARRFLDRVVGYMLSPLLWKKVARGLSAGRVQSVAARLVVEREREIRAFVPEEYWEILADLVDGLGHYLKAQVVKVAGNPFRPGNHDDAQTALGHLRGADYAIGKREDKPKKQRPNAPFITSTLQQAASVRLGFGVKKTMTMAQRLYEAGYITYMRTDSTNLSADAVQGCREWISKQYGEQYLPEKPNVYSSKQSAQEAHEAIRPSDVRVEQHELKGMDNDAVRLYELLRNQFIACQMPPAEFDTTLMVINATPAAGPAYELRANGRVMRFDGWMKVMPPVRKGDKEDQRLPDLQSGTILKLLELHPSQHFTKPPARFSEASLVRELEKRGIGRPSTYASIISTIQDRGYVRVDKRRFYAEKMGDIVTDRLVENFGDLLNYGFTAGLEDKLDSIAQGKADWIKELDDFYAHFTKELQQAEDETGMRKVDPTPTQIACKVCGRPMAVRTARTGVFLSCTGYNLPKDEKCSATMNLVSGDEAVDADLDEESESRALQHRRRCPLCGTAMDSYLVDETRKLHVCGNNPDCSGTEVEQGQFKIKGYDGPIIECDKCGANMELKSGRFGKYFGCTAYPECRNTRKLLRNGEVAPPKADPVPMPELPCEKSNGHFVLRDGAVGIFLASSNYPRSRETRNPLVADLARHRTELDPKHLFLADAPPVDEDGNPFVIRFARKSKSYYISAEAEDGKPSGWTGHFIEGSWKLEKTEKKKAAKRAASATS